MNWLKFEVIKFSLKFFYYILSNYTQQFSARDINAWPYPPPPVGVLLAFDA